MEKLPLFQVLCVNPDADFIVEDIKLSKKVNRPSVDMDEEGQQPSQKSDPFCGSVMNKSETLK